jgi:hypothetical protein
MSIHASEGSGMTLSMITPLLKDIVVGDLKFGSILKVIWLYTPKHDSSVPNSENACDVCYVEVRLCCSQVKPDILTLFSG